ncbi:MAG TPA: DUF2062 domain-containing protein [Acidobacteriota bacterium]|nr:DUF2062 domain-containing protein [Acidobacteriota bacterium]
MLRRTTKEYLRRLLALDDTPERIAFAFALGVFLAFSPLLGLHTLLGLTLAFVFGLNRVAVLLGVWVNNPWTLVPIYGAAAFIGSLLFGFPPGHALPPFDWGEFWHGGFWRELIGDWSMLRPIVLGSTILSFVGALLSYPIALYVVRQGKAFHLHHRR